MSKQLGVENVLPKIKSDIMKDREYMEKVRCFLLRWIWNWRREYQSVAAFVSYISAYKQHQAHYIFQLKELDLGKLANGFCLLRVSEMMPKEGVCEG